MVLTTGFLPSLFAQCTNSSPFGFATAPVNATITVTTCQFGGEYHEISGCAASTTYQSATSIPTDFITVHRNTFNGPVVASGLTPLTWTSTTAGTYFVHVNTNSGCGTDFSCRSVTIAQTCSTPAPTGGIASPATICAGLSSNVQATSAGNTIHWFTVPSGGASIGTSGSGAPFAVTPTVTTTYYASAFNGSCFSGRTPVTVTVNPAPTIVAIDANPDTICIGATSQLMVSGCGQVSNFTSTYAPANWVTTHVPTTDIGIVHTTGAPTSIAIESSDGGNFGNHSVIWTVNVPCDGTISFNWSYFTTDVDGAGYDNPEYAINGVNQGFLPGYNPAGSISQSGTFNLGVTAGQTFSLIMTATDDILGPATTTYTNWQGPGGSNTATINWFTVPVGGVSIGSSLTGANFPVTPGTTTTYYAQATSGGCTSTPRTPITVTVQSCILPIEDARLRGITDGQVNNLFWEVSEASPALTFEIERSADGQDFQPIGTLTQGSPEGDQIHFNYVDGSPLPQDNFYRLRYIGPNGDLTHSNTIRLRLTDPMNAFTLSPNPSNGPIRYEFHSRAATKSHLEIIDIYGRTVHQQDIPTQSGLNTLNLDLSHLAPGPYTFRAHQGTAIHHITKLVLQD